MRRSIALAAAGLLLTGCSAKLGVAGSAWTRPSTMYQKVTLDEIDCARRMRELPRSPELGIGGVADLARIVVAERATEDAFARCMTDLGYTPVAGR